MNDLFGPIPASHDPGGKVKTRLPAGMTGDAKFYGLNEEYRLWLSRSWGPGLAYALWIGMNPSTATGLFNDPTVSREISYTRDMLGLDRYIKCNVMDIRCTDSKQLRALGAKARSDRNLETILHFAKDAEKIIVCYGSLHKSLQPFADETVHALLDAGHELWCRDFIAAGHPKHPLYVALDKPLERFPRA